MTTVVKPIMSADISIMTRMAAISATPRSLTERRRMTKVRASIIFPVRSNGNGRQTRDCGGSRPWKDDSAGNRAAASTSFRIARRCGRSPSESNSEGERPHRRAIRNDVDAAARLPAESSFHGREPPQSRVCRPLPLERTGKIMDARTFVIRLRSVSERGVALIAAILVMMLMSALMIGFTTVVISDQRYRGLDRDRTRAFYAAHSGIEKLTSDLGALFLVNVAPTAAQVAALANNPPVITDVMYAAPPGITAYGATLKGSSNGQILSGPYQGLIALKKFYNLDVVARTLTGGEAHLMRRVETVAIPVFQFGMFSDVDLSFSAADNFDFGGRVHTNGNLFLAQGGLTSSTLTLRDKVTAVKEIVRQRLSNTNSIDNSGSVRTVRVATATNTFRDLARTEGSVTDGLNPPTLNNNWTTISLGTYNGYIRNGRTGAKALNLPLLTMGASTVDLVRRPPANED